MADNSVFITGANEGALARAFNGLPPWASEKTAGQMEKYLRKSHGVQLKILDEIKKCCANSGGGDAGGAGQDVAKKLNNELDRSARHFKIQNDEFKKQQKRDKEKEEQDKKSFLGGEQLDTTNKKLNYIFTSLATIGSKVLKTDKEYIDVYDALYKSGINVLNGNNATESGFQSLQDMVRLTGLRLETLQKIVEKHSSTINVVGMTKFTQAISKSSQRLTELGYSTEAQGELIATLMESEIGYSDVRNKSAQQIANDAIKLGAQLGKLSLTVGMSRQQLQENIKANSKTISSAFVAAKFGTEAAAKMNASFAGIKDAGLKDMFMQLAAAANPAQVQGYNELVAAGMGDVAEQMNQLAKSSMTLDPQEFFQKFTALASYTEQQTGRMSNLTNLLGKGGEAAATVLNGFYQQGRDVSRATEGQADNATKTEHSIARFQSALESASATLQKLFRPLESQLHTLSGTIEFLNDRIKDFNNVVSSTTMSYIGAGLIVLGFGTVIIGAIKSVGTFLSLFSKSAATGPGILTRAFRGIASGATKFFGWIKTSVTALIASLRGMASGGGRGGAASAGSAGRTAGTAGKLGRAVAAGAAAAAGLAVAAGGDALLGLAGVGGNTIDAEQDEKNWQMMTTMEKMQSGLARGIEGVFDLFFMENIANEQASARIKNETEYLKSRAAAANQKTAGSKVVPPSNINQPSPTGVETGNNDVNAKLDEAQSIEDEIEESSKLSFKEPKSGNSLDSLLTRQSFLLEQILEGTNRLVSVNNDILRYARNS